MAEARESAAAAKPLARSAGAAEPAVADRVHVWPYLVRNEFICSIIVMVILTVWSITINAPLEEPANPTQTPDRKSTRLNSSHIQKSRMPSSA